MPINPFENPINLVNGIDTANNNAIGAGDKVVYNRTTGQTINEEIDSKEDSLGNPTTDGQVLSSTAAGVRSWTTTTTGTDENAIHDNVAGEINAITEKTTPADADILIIEDSADSNNKKKIQISNLPETDVDVLNLPTLTLNESVVIDTEEKYNTWVNHRIVNTTNNSYNFTLPQLVPSTDRDDYVRHGDLWAFHHDPLSGDTHGGISVILAGGAGNEGFSDNVRSGNSRHQEADEVHTPGTNMGGPYVLLQTPEDGEGSWSVLSFDPDSSDFAMAAASYWEPHGEGDDAPLRYQGDAEVTGTFDAQGGIVGLERTSTIYVSNSGDNTYSGVAIDRPVTNFTRVWDIVDNDGFSYAAGALVKCDDDSYLNEAITMRQHFDLWMPEGSCRGLTLADGTVARVKTILTSIGEIVMAPNARLIAQRIENGTTGSQIQFPSGDLGNVNIKIYSADFGTTPMTFTAGTNSGNIHVEIDKSDLTADPFNDVRTDYNITGYIVLSNGTAIYYGGGQGNDLYVRSLDESVTADFERPVMLFRNETAGRTLTLPAASASPKDRHVHRFMITNHSFASTSHNLNVVIASSGTFESGENGFELRPNGSAIVELWDVPEGSFWKYNIIETRYLARIETSATAEDTSPVAIYENLQVNSNADLPANLFSIDTNGDVVVGAKCRIKIDSLSADLRWNADTENFVGSDLIRSGSAVSGGDGLTESQKDVDQTFTFASAFTHGADSDIHVVTTPTQLNRTEVLPVVATTKTGFTINRAGEVDGDVGFHYVATNSATQSDGSADAFVEAEYQVMKDDTVELTFSQSPQPKVRDHTNKVFTLTDGDGWIDFDASDVMKIKRNFGSLIDSFGVDNFQMNVEVIIG